jgi:hypothetical protein
LMRMVVWVSRERVVVVRAKKLLMSCRIVLRNSGNGLTSYSFFSALIPRNIRLLELDGRLATSLSRALYRHQLRANMMNTCMHIGARF